MSEGSSSLKDHMEEMGRQLVEEALGDSPVRFAPMDDRVMIFPVMPDEERPVDIHVVQLGGQDLPEMGVVCSVGWKVNESVLSDLETLDSEIRYAETDFDTTEKRIRREALMATEFLGQGEIVCVNKFSGMDVPGTNFILVSRQDVLGKLHNFPVRLRKEQDRWDIGDAGTPQAVDTLATPSASTIIPAR